MTAKRRTPRPRGETNRRKQLLLRKRAVEAEEMETDEPDRRQWADITCTDHISYWVELCPNCVVAQDVSE